MIPTINDGSSNCTNYDAFDKVISLLIRRICQFEFGLCTDVVDFLLEIMEICSSVQKYVSNYKGVLPEVLIESFPERYI